MDQDEGRGCRACAGGGKNVAASSALDVALLVYEKRFGNVDRACSGLEGCRGTVEELESGRGFCWTESRQVESDSRSVRSLLGR